MLELEFIINSSFCTLIILLIGKNETSRVLIREECDSECISEMPKAYDVWNDLVRLEKPGHVILLLCITYTLRVWRCLNNSIQPCRTQLFHCHQKKTKIKKRMNPSEAEGTQRRR